MILLIDNYDSFSYNLFQLVGEVYPDIKVIRNDDMTVAEIRELAPEAIIISPGPGRPEDAGICVEAVRQLSGEIPILGVCLGHQSIFQAFGGTVTYASELMHGKSSLVQVDTTCPLFAGLANPVQVARYHSLAGDPSTLPAQLKVTAQTDLGEIMAVQHISHPTFGVQFHPESIMTPEGRTMLKNFVTAFMEFNAM
ncbi:MAG: aminodeoxychorismate/anthranilate synthase component II [Eggerthellales bacterium]|nr:aminodeoxychorismate/anthranilate synthase component II [Eggerthellales bacterium]